MDGADFGERGDSLGERVPWLPCSCKFQSGFGPLSRPELLFSCVAKRKVTKREGHPAWRLPGILPGKSVSRGRTFRTGLLPVRKGESIHGLARCAACRPRLTAAQGPRVEQRAILARTTRCATAARWRRTRSQEPLFEHHSPSM